MLPPQSQPDRKTQISRYKFLLFKNLKIKFVLRDTEDSVFLGFVYVGGVAISVESVKVLPLPPSIFSTCCTCAYVCACLLALLHVCKFSKPHFSLLNMQQCVQHEKMRFRNGPFRISSSLFSFL